MYVNMHMCLRSMRDLDEIGKCRVVSAEIAYVDHFSFLSAYNLFMGVSQNSGDFQN